MTTSYKLRSAAGKFNSFLTEEGFTAASAAKALSFSRVQAYDKLNDLGNPNNVRVLEFKEIGDIGFELDGKTWFVDASIFLDGEEPVVYFDEIRDFDCNEVFSSSVCTVDQDFMERLAKVVGEYPTSDEY